MNSFFVFRAKNIVVCLLFLIGFISACLMGNAMVNQVIETTTANRLLPIYSVETERKVVALTFDCAWRSGRYFNHH